jgi:hypothetical protein
MKDNQIDLRDLLSTRWWPRGAIDLGFRMVRLVALVRYLSFSSSLDKPQTAGVASFELVSGFELTPINPGLVTIDTRIAVRPTQK